MVKEKLSPSPLPFVLRRRDNITANERTSGPTLRAKRAISSTDEDDEDFSPDLDLHLKPTASQPQAESGGRVTRRSARNSKDLTLTPKTETDENGVSKETDDDEEDMDVQRSTEESSSSDDNEDHPDTDEMEMEAHVRRSSRQKYLKYGSYQESHLNILARTQESWMLGGGPVAKGYPRRADLTEMERRRSSRTMGKPNYASDPLEGLEIENDDDGNESEDMYSRVKKRRTSLNGAVTQITPDEDGEVRSRRSRSRLIPGKQDEEPVARRLRDRATLSLGMNSQNRYGFAGPAKSSRIDMMLKKRMRKMRKRRRQTQSPSSSSSSSSDSDDEQQSPSKKRPRKRFYPGGGQSFHMGQTSKKERMMLMEAQPIAVDPKINFQCVGGLDQFIGKLKEIVLFPLMYTEFYAETKMRPPRGILLHGPPGTGKTLLARALATECANINGKKVSFFLRKGADLLNKWIGESERQLRVLFQQAAQHQPSIIFFDEIDGLAPVRSSKSDQVHNSIVSTLLAELDGLQDRGQVIVIGSTNRLDFVDPALRRPGRFDCELPIFLPTRDGRRDILRVLVADWKDPVSEEMLDHLADRSIGFSGADLKLLCWTTCMNSLRRRYPQIYTSTQKYALNYASIKREREDWELALKTVSPSTNRSIFSKYSPAQPLPLFVSPLLQETLDTAAKFLDKVFPWKSVSVIGENSTKRLVLRSDPDSGVDEYIVPALLHKMETLPVYVLSSESLFMDNFAAECSVTQICMEAAKQTGPCIMYIPNADRLCNLLSDSAKEILIRMITQSLRKPILILATVNHKISENERDDFWKLFSGSFLTLEGPSTAARRQFLEPVFHQATVVKISQEESRVLEELPLAPPESPEKKTLSDGELKAIEKRETAVLRELRIFLREILLKLARNKKFAEFTKPVDLTEVPDYLEVIESPMDLETMMFKLNMGEYMSAGQFLDDVKLIAENCLNYNPHKDESDKRLRMRAFELLDFANTLIEKEMDSDYEDQCKEIIKARDERKAAAARKDPKTEANPSTSAATSSGPPAQGSAALSRIRKVRLPPTPRTPTANSNSNTNASQTSAVSASSSVKRRRKKASSWSKGLVNKYKRKLVKKPSAVSTDSKSPVLVQDTESEEINLSMDTEDPVVSESRPLSPLALPSQEGQRDQDMEMTVLTESEASVSTRPESESGSGDKFVSCKNREKYKKVFEDLLDVAVKVSSSKDFTLVKLLNLRFSLLRLVDKHQCNEDKAQLAAEIRTLLKPESQSSQASSSSSNPTARISSHVKVPSRSPRL